MRANTKITSCKYCGCELIVPKMAPATRCDDCKKKYQDEYNKRRKLKRQGVAPNKEPYKAYTIVSVPPDSDWAIGASFSADNFLYTLKFGFFDSGMKFKNGRKVVTVWELDGQYYAR